VEDTARTLAFTATTSSGEVLEFQLPLHPHTSSETHVGTLLEGVLDRVSELVEGPDNMSDGDVLQALTLAMAVRLKVAGLAPETAQQLVEDLANLALEGYEGGEQVASAGTRH
jgi:hypothetical protein